MTTRTLFLSTMAAAAVVSIPAFAADDVADVTLTVTDTHTVLSVVDIDFSWNGAPEADLTSTTNMCVYTNEISHGYDLTATGSNSDGTQLRLSDGDSSNETFVPYSLSFQPKGASSFTALPHGTATAFNTTTAAGMVAVTDTACSGNMSSIRGTVLQSDAEAAGQGTYTDSVTFTTADRSTA